jgi:hypothetical protein
MASAGGGVNPDNRVAVEDERLKAEAEKRRAELIAKWRRAHPDATCSDAVALTLAILASSVGRLA